MKYHSLFVMLFPIFLAIFTGCGLEMGPPADRGSKVPPQDLESQRRTEQERQILASTVRIQMRSWTEFDPAMGREPITKEGVSHATIIGGRYLVTHNHFKASPAYQGEGTSTSATLYDAYGELIVAAAPFSVVFEDAETLVLEFSDKEGNGLFETLGLPSAEVMAWESLPLKPGREVAQVDWDGSQATVNWVMVEAVQTEAQTPRLALAHRVNEGASGGGIFWEGYHVGNNWSRVRQWSRQDGQLLSDYSTAALNAPQVTALGMRVAAGDHRADVAPKMKLGPGSLTLQS